MPRTRRWAKQLADIVHKFDYGEKPPVVLLHVYPPTLTVADIARFISEDGLSRGCKWKIGGPQHLEPLGLPLPLAMQRNDETLDNRNERGEAASESQPHRDTDPVDKLRSRFVVVCANEAEARRFHRHWNQRTLTAGPGLPESRNIVHASIINW